MKSPNASSNGIQRFTHLEKIPEHSNMFKAFERATLSPIAIKRNKKFAMSPRNVEKARRLQPILQLVDHPHIAKSIDHLVDQNDMFTILEYVPNSAVAATVVKQRAVTNFINLPVLSAEEISIITRQLLDALRYLHTFPSGSIVCRDITPDNIILTGVGPTISCKLLDFTAAMTEDEIPSDKALAIKRLYTSPEQYRALEGLALADDAVDSPSDMWNLGATLLDLATGMKLIDMAESSLQALRYGYTDWSFEQDVLSAMSDDQYSLWCRQEEFVRLVIARSLRVHMKARPSAAEMLQLDDVLHARMQKTKRKSKAKKGKDLEEQPPDSQRLLTPSPMRQRRLQTPSRTKPSAVKTRSSSVKKSVTIAAAAGTDYPFEVTEQAAQPFPMVLSHREEPPQDGNSLASIRVSDSLLNASHVIPMSTTLVLSSPTVISPSIPEALQRPSPDHREVAAEATHPVLKRSNSPVGSPTAVRSVRQKLGFQSVDMEPRTATTPTSSRSPVPTVVDVAAMARRMVTADSMSSISTADALHQIARALSTYSDSPQVNLLDESTVIAALSATTTQDTATSTLPSPVSRRSLERQQPVSSRGSPRAVSASPYSSRTASTIAAIAETLVQAPTTIDSDASSVDSDRRSVVSSDNTLPTNDDSLSIDLQAMTLMPPLQPSVSPLLASPPPSAMANEQVGDTRIDKSDVAYSAQGYRVYRHEHIVPLPSCATSSATRTAHGQRSLSSVPVAWLAIPHATLRRTVTLLAMVSVSEPSTVDVWEFVTAFDGGCAARIKAHHRGSLTLDDDGDEGNEEVTSLLSLTTSGGLCAGYADGSVRIWDITSLVPSSDDETITGAVCIHRLSSAELHTAGVHKTAVRCLLQSSWYGRLVVGRSDGVVSVWTLAGQQPLFELAQHQAAVTALVEISDIRIVSSSEDGTLRLWHLEQRQCLHVFRGHVHGVSSLALWTTASGQYLFSGGKDETLRIWDVDGRRGIGIVKHHHATDRGGVGSFAWVESAAGEDVLAVGGADGQVSLWSPSLLTSSGTPFDSDACIQRIPHAVDVSGTARQPLTLPSTLIAAIDGSSSRPTSVRTDLGETKAIHHSGPLAVVSSHNNLSFSLWL